MAVAESGSGGGAPQVKQVQASSSPQSVQSQKLSFTKCKGIWHPLLHMKGVVVVVVDDEVVVLELLLVVLVNELVLLVVEVIDVLVNVNVLVVLLEELDEVLLVVVDDKDVVVNVFVAVVLLLDELEELLVVVLVEDVEEVVVVVTVVVVAFVSPAMHGTKVPQILGHPGGGSSCNSNTSFGASKSGSALFSAWGFAIPPRG